MRPVRAKALYLVRYFKAFALSGRQVTAQNKNPGRCPGLRASALSGRAAVGCLTIRACCLYGQLGLQGDAVMGFWACCLYGLLALWALLSHANFAEFSSCMVEITLHALLYGWNYPACPSVRLKLPYTPFFMVEITQHALLYGWIYPARPERAEAPSPGQRPGLYWVAT